ncbi:MAG: hypothetical protein L3V56_08930, partial [Candidatus Magnetoovum sp. WYHC-5]|nr:hypothetical protein [Candidatus Magnetoovum sp. WYHC-5]
MPGLIDAKRSFKPGIKKTHSKMLEENFEIKLDNADLLVMPAQDLGKKVSSCHSVQHLALIVRIKVLGKGCWGITLLPKRVSPSSSIFFLFL